MNLSNTPQNRNEPGQFRKIMIVDDDQVDRFILKRQIQSSKIGNEIVEANNGVEALRIIGDISETKETQPDLIFLDIDSALLDGFAFLEALDKLKGEYTRRMQIVIICSVKNEEESQRAFNYDCVIDYLVKPLLDEQLIQLSKLQRFKQVS